MDLGDARDYDYVRGPFFQLILREKKCGSKLGVLNELWFDDE